MTMMTIHSFSQLVITVSKINIDDFRKSHYYIYQNLRKKKYLKLDPVGSTVRYEMMKLCTGSV